MSTPLPNVRPEHETLAYWLSRNESYGPLDEPLLSANEIQRHNLALREPGDSGELRGQVDLLVPVDRGALRTQVGERLAYLREKLEASELVDENEKPIDASAIALFDAAHAGEELEEWRTADDLTPLRCGPFDGGLYRSPIDIDFDRNRCSTIRNGEVVQLLARWDHGMYLARTPYALGWLSDRSLSPPMGQEAVRTALEEGEIQPLTRRAVLTEAFSMLGQPYGWGGKDGGYDCSRLLLDLFGHFGLELPRHSARQAMAGTFSLDVSGLEDLNEKRLLIEASARRGIVLLQFPGHIMLYLGTTEEGAPMGLHAFSEFLTPCEGTEAETINRVDRVAVSDLTLGAESSRRDFLSRITRVTVIGQTPGPTLAADAELRPSAPIVQPAGRCADSKRIAIFRTPRRPSASEPLRVVVTSERDPGLASLVLFAPDGSLVQATEHVLDGPPYSRWIEVSEPSAGQWTAVFGDGDRTMACQRIKVAARSSRSRSRTAPGPAWPIEAQWNSATENLYSAFIEQLFRDPAGDDVTWPTLQTLIGERGRNLLYDYRAPGEDAQLDLEPDCADLPYFLRAYFSWKLRLPFGYRACTRGGKREPPRCEPIAESNLDSVPDDDDVDAFARFVRRLAGTVHSSSPRTPPSDDETDFYPVRLSRRAIRAGAVFADPYGHVLVVARWKPQRMDDYGVLIGADAQPDGTVGRRRFWRGSFLFTPETDLVGAGFKAWRPVSHTPDEPTELWQVATNEELRRGAGPRAWSDMQYRRSADDFYSTMEGLINPRPLDPVRRQISLVDALEESVQRRLSSVQNGEDFMKAERYAPIDMPHGSALFLTTGPWEDFSTPSRDMRLLISIDAVVSFPDAVAQHPERFGLRETHCEAAAQRVQKTLDQELERRSFEYIRSDGSTWRLSLADVVDRISAMEMAYNPNDCVEIRWGAPEGSEERSSCDRRAPEEQQRRMESYRKWFADRQRPG
ncbi:MAG: NlpC/P60 family protein [Polyangiales bacterium]